MFGSGTRLRILAPHPRKLVSHPSGLAKKITLIILNKEMKDTLKIVQSIEESGLLIKYVSKTIVNEAKEQKGGFLRMLLGTLGAILLWNILTGKGTIRASQDFQFRLIL